MSHSIWDQSRVWRETLLNGGEKKRRRNDHLNCVCLVSGWDGDAGSESPMTSRHGQQQCDIDTFLLSIMDLLPSLLSQCRCVPPHLLFIYAIFSPPCCFSFGIVLCPVLFCTSLLYFPVLYCTLSHTALYCSVVLSSIKQGEHAIVLTTHSLCTTVPEALSQKSILSE